jgi:hypothetical protein
MLIGGKRFALLAFLYVLAPLVFLANYFPRAPETRPFHVETSVNLAVAMLGLAVLATPVVVWKARGKRGIVAGGAAVALGAFVIWTFLAPFVL